MGALCNFDGTDEGSIMALVGQDIRCDGHYKILSSLRTFSVLWFDVTGFMVQPFLPPSYHFPSSQVKSIQATHSKRPRSNRCCRDCSSPGP